MSRKAATSLIATWRVVAAVAFVWIAVVMPACAAGPAAACTPGQQQSCPPPGAGQDAAPQDAGMPEAAGSD